MRGEKLLMEIKKLKDELEKEKFEKFKRVNPFAENITNWKEKANKYYPNKNITLYDSTTLIGDVEIGENTWVGPFTILDGQGGLKIGSNCSISSKVHIMSHDTVKWALSGGKLPYEYAPIEIGNNCFIGTGAFISKGVKIGNQCLIGAGSVVTKDIPDNSIALGVPAKIKGKIENNLKGEISFIYQ